jgi:hypothetical protein
MNNKLNSEYIKKKLLECKYYIKLYNSQPIITYVNVPNNRIIAIGDIHGDIDLMLNTLLLSKVIKKTNNNKNAILLNNKGNEEYYEWIGKNSIIVQVGDQIDRCRPTSENNCLNNITYKDEASDIEILLFYTNLNELAKKYGGAVYSLLGNHELMNCFGDIRYVSYANLKQVQTSDDLTLGRKKIFRRGGTISKFLACSRSAIIIVNNYLFVHGGILGSLIAEIQQLDKKNNIFEILNDVISKWLIYNDKDLYNILENKYYNNKIYNKLFEVKNINKFIFYSDSPFYIRKLGMIQPNIKITDMICKDIEILVNYFKLKGIIIGHTPQYPNGINGTCSNKLYRIDIASSKAFYYMLSQLLNPEVLEISNHIKILKSFNP